MGAQRLRLRQVNRILLGISGGIAAYKTPDLARRLRDAGAEVQVVMTHSAAAFVAPLSLQAASGRMVRQALLDPEAEAGMDHIELARWADVLLIAPATAHLMARLTHGFADDLLTTLALATAAPLVLAPAMNHQMWAHPVTQDNLSRLIARGVRVLGPATGAQACGEHGMGRMLEPAEIVAALAEAPSQPLAGRRVLITAGPTREAIDPVRFLGNRSSGRMGYALAEALIRRGADVTLVSGPSTWPPPSAANLVRVESAREMAGAVMAHVTGCDIFIAAAAVADYRPVEVATTKIKKGKESLTIELARNPDILAEVTGRSDRPFAVGFAAETDRLEEHAQAKLKAKRLDMIAANWVGAERGGFDAEDNALLVFWPGGRRALPMMAKTRLADQLADLILERYLASTAG